MIADALAALAEPIGKAQLHPDNPRRGNVEGIASSLARFGQVRPILVQQSSGFIIAGNHTYQAAVSLGWKKIAVVRVDLSDEQARAYMLADNRWSDVAENDDEALARILRELGEAGELDGTGYSADDLDDLLSLLDRLPVTDPEPTAAAHSESDDETAARFKPPAAPMVEVVLMMRSELKPGFATDLAALRQAWGTTGVTDTVMRAVRSSVEALAEPEPVAPDA
jgi:ParB-like chromosome segregation protein Spo0J